MRFGANTVSVQATSPDASYASRVGCGKFIADFHVFASAAVVLPGSLPGVYFTPSAGEGPYTWVLTEADCVTYHDTTDLYVKHYGEASFTDLGRKTAQGSWSNNGFCSVVFGTTLPASFFDPPASNVDVYRTASTHEVLGQKKRVTITAQHAHQ